MIRGKFEWLHTPRGNRKLVRACIAALLLSTMLILLVACTKLAPSQKAADAAARADACASVSVGDVAGFRGTFSMDGRSATEQEIEQALR